MICRAGIQNETQRAGPIDSNGNVDVVVADCEWETFDGCGSLTEPLGACRGASLNTLLAAWSNERKRRPPKHGQPDHCDCKFHGVTAFLQYFHVTEDCDAGKP